MTGSYPDIIHHGAVTGVTGSCHELRVDASNSILIDCGLFQGAEVSPSGATATDLSMDFPIERILALVVTHVHIDHVGRIPYLLSAGFSGPIYCSEPSALLLPLVLEDAIKIGFTRDKDLVMKFLKTVQDRIVAIPYERWIPVPVGAESHLEIRLQPAGHILGSAYVECQTETPGQGEQKGKQTIVFSGDLGAPDAALLPEPESPNNADVVVLESTYGNRLHDQRQLRQQRLKAIVERAIVDRGVILIPAFSIGRTQELLYELEAIIHQHRQQELRKGMAWEDIEVIVDSPLASRFTAAYRQLAPYWDQEAKSRKVSGRHPLSFDQLTTIGNHTEHMATVEYLKRTARPCIVIAASGMCAGGRIVNYLKALLADKRNDILFVGYQAKGTPGRAIQKYGPRNGYVEFDGVRYAINAQVHTISGYSAHADQKDLVNFIQHMRQPPKLVRLVHGNDEAKQTLGEKLRDLGVRVMIPNG